MRPALPPPGDPFRYTTTGHRGHGLCSPLSMAKLERLLVRLPVGPSDVVLDLAGGKGLLARAVAARTGAAATVVDANPYFLAEGSAALDDLRSSPGLAADLDELVFTARDADATSPEVTFVQGDVAELVAADKLPPLAKLVACVGARPWTDETDDTNGRRATLAALADLTAPGGGILVGEGYWRADPDPALVSFLGGAGPAEVATRFGDHPRLAAEAGLELRWSHAATPHEFETYDRRFCDALGAWCAAHPDDPDAPAFAERLAAWDGVMARSGRATMGFGWYLYGR